MPMPEAKTKTTYINIPETLGVFDSFGSLRAAIYDLRMAGFSRYDISLLGSAEELKEVIGSAYWQASELEDNPDAPRAAFVSAEETGKLQGVVAGGFFFLGSYIAMAAMLTPGQTGHQDAR